MNGLDRAGTGAIKHPISKLLWIGLAILIVGTGPLLAIILAASMGWTRDPNPNPIGPGILAGLTMWPGLGLTVAGAIITFNRRGRCNPHSRHP